MEYTSSQLASLLNVSERTIQRWMKEGKLPAQATTRNRYHVEEEALERLQPGETIAALQQWLESLETAVSLLQTRLDSVEGLLQQNTPTKTLRPAPASYAVASGELPDGLVSLRDFALLHHVPGSTVKRAREAGEFPSIAGKWKRGNHYISHALDAAGRAAFFARYNAEPYFTACEACPHSLSKTAD